VKIFYKTAESAMSVSGNSRSELADIDGKACNNIPGAVNKLALSARLDQKGRKQKCH
jgi:hypothetical protein